MLGAGGERLKPPETKIALPWKITTAITRPAPFPPFDRLRAGLGRAGG